MSNKLKRRSPNYSSNRLQSAGNAAGVIRCTNVRADPKYFLLENNTKQQHRQQQDPAQQRLWARSCQDGAHEHLGNGWELTSNPTYQPC